MVKEQKLEGIKTLWPETYSLKKIASIGNEILRQHDTIPDNGLIFGVIDSVKVEVRVSKKTNKIKSVYPSWIQE